MMIPFRRTRIAAAVGGLAFALSAGHALGAAFALQETTASGLGNAFAGGAAIAEDAGTAWSNPAGMSRFATTQVSATMHLLTPSVEFSNEGTQTALNQQLGGEGGDAGNLNFIPAMFGVIPINKQFAFGLSVTGPFGLKTQYGEGWMGRYLGVKSDIKTLNVNPSMSWKVSDRVSLGAGLSYQRIDATFTNAVNYSAALAQAAGTAAAGGQIPAALVPQILAATPNLDANANVTGDDGSWGWNVGALFDLDAKSRVGVHYRSAIKYNVNGNVEFSLPTLPTVPAQIAPVVAGLAAAVNANPALANGGVTSDIELPQMFNVSYFRTLNDKWDVMADAQWTGWSSIENLTFVRTTGVLLKSTPENFEDAWRLSVGTNYRHNDKWMFRFGFAWDQTPVQDDYRTPRLPDSDRLWFSTGARYVLSKNMWTDVGLTYINASSASINDNAGSTAANGRLVGSYDSSVTILSGQLTYQF